MTERVLPYNREIVPQQTFYWCGPAAAQVVLNARGIDVDERDLAERIGTDADGTDYVGLITPILNDLLDGGYVERYIDHDPATAEQTQQLWDDIVASIDAGYGVIANIVAPVGNYPRGVKGSSSPAYGGGTVFHYIAIMGYSDDGERAVWVADSGFRPFGYWCGFEQMATLIPPKGYIAAPGKAGGPVMKKRGLDFAGGRPGGRNIRAAGYDFVVRYLSPGGVNLPGKQLLAEEADDYREHGVEIVSNWETYADRMLGGYTAGVEDAQLALAHVHHCGGRRDRPIYFSADWDASAGEQPLIDGYLRGAASVIGAENVGVYGGYWVVKRCLDNGTAAWAWQAQAWSGGQVDPRIHILQRNNDGYADVAGVQCDINEAITADYGQWNGDDMGFLDEELENWAGQPVKVRQLLRYLDLYTGLVLDQLVGPRARERDGVPTRWEELGNRTVVEALAVLLEKADIAAVEVSGDQLGGGAK